MPVDARYQHLLRDAEASLAQRTGPGGPVVTVGLATCGIAAGALETRSAFEATLEQRGLSARIETVGCMGHCYAEPVVIIDHPDSGFPPILYPQVDAGKARMLTKLFIEEGDPRLEHILGPGRYAFWKGVAEAKVVEVGLRESMVDVSGQDIMTADCSKLR